MPDEAERVRKAHEKKLRAFLGRLRADLLSFGMPRRRVWRLEPHELVIEHDRHLRRLMNAPQGRRWDD